MDMPWSFIAKIASLHGAGSLLAGPARWMLRKHRGWSVSELIPDRTALERIDGTYTAFHDSTSEVYAFWLSGQGVLPNIKESNNIKCLVLPDPENAQHMRDLERLFDLDYDLAEKVRAMTDKARKKAIKVRWYKRTFPSVSLTFFNPSDSRKGYVNLGLIMPHIAEESRPLVRIYRKRDERVFAHLWQSFGDIRNDLNSREAP